MSPQKALTQFEALFKYAPKVLRFIAVDNIVPKEYLTEVFPHLQTPENAELFYEIKTNLRDHQVKVLAKAGVKEIQPGIEALATSTLKLMRKGTTAFQNIRFLISCLVHGIRADWNLLIGFPGESEAVFEKYCRDLPFLFHLPPPTGVYPVRFDRFSPYFELAKEYGLALKPYDFYEFVYPFGEKDLSEFAYFFADHNYSAAHNKLTAKWIKKLEAQVDRWRRRWYQRDKKLKPRLSFELRGGSRIVCDSRSGTEVEHQVGVTGLRILDLLTAPMTLPRMTEKMDDVPGPELQEQVASLQAKGLLFQEKDHHLSLVVEYE
jgi:ribosomal peptide maturation radical SAM protein 1